MNASDIPHWEKLPAADRLIYLRAFFSKGDVKRATRQELEDYMVLLAITPFTDNPKAHEEAERFTSVVQHLLQVRISEELHRRSYRLSVAAIIVSALAALAAIFKIWRG